MNSILERTLARHCGAVLLNKKPASMVSIPNMFRHELLNISKALGEGLCARILACRAKSDLVLIYRPALLQNVLDDERVCNLLAQTGYRVSGGLGATLDYLSKRICQASEFPHEVGIFLGYPYDDVTGFIENKGRNFKQAGLWRVYGDVHTALSLSMQYSLCSSYLMAHIENGGCLSELCMEPTGYVPV